MALFGTVPLQLGARALSLKGVNAEEVIPQEQESVFGILTIDDDAKPRFAPTNDVPNLELQTYGYFIWVGKSAQTVRWTETFSAPLAHTWANFQSEASFSISSEGRTLTIHREMEPIEGFIFSSWVVEKGDAPGPHEMVVSLEGGRIETFSFELGSPLGECPYLKAYFDLWWKKYTPGGDPEGIDLSTQVLMDFGSGLIEHGVGVAEEVADAYWMVDVIAVRMNDPGMAHGHINMRAFAMSSGEPVRPTSDSFAADHTIEYGFLFAYPIDGLDESIREIADQFAETLLPHARHMCLDWINGELEKEARLQEIREGLVEEIERIRQRRRDDEEQRKELNLELERRGERD
jgi:hypothetical protein